MKYEDAFAIANEMVKSLRPACQRIEIAGSIRRLKEDVKDIEIVAVPDMHQKPTYLKPEFGRPVPIQYGTILDELLATGKNGLEDGFEIKLEKNGDKYKKIKLVNLNVCVDLFLVTPPAMWGVQYLIRTGPADFSHWMVTQKRYGGALPNSCRVKDGAVWDEGDKSKYPIHEEEDFFRLCGMEFVEPEDREARWRR